LKEREEEENDEEERKKNRVRVQTLVDQKEC
jgi:hypothetical protein